MPQGELLQLNNVDVTFAGEYSCKIVTEIGTTQRLTKLVVTGMLFNISEQDIYRETNEYVQIWHDRICVLQLKVIHA